MSRTIFVTGGNSGIDYALCRQLAAERDCRVLLGARSVEKGEKAASDIASTLPSDRQKNVEFVQCDVSNDASVKSAAEEVKSKLESRGHSRLYAVVNNAGVGLMHGKGPDEVLNTNLRGPKRVCDAFLPLLCPKMGRIVNLGSGAGPSYVEGVKDVETQKILCGFGKDPLTWDWIERHAEEGKGTGADTYGGYGLSKALLACYTMVLASEHPAVTSSCVSPGFIDTNMTKGYGASKTPEEGTVSILHCLFEKLEGNGWYYGSDAFRSLHFMRDPGSEPYDGKNPFV